MPIMETNDGSGGDFFPIVKYDARSGRITRVDRNDAQPLTDITHGFNALFDFSTLEVGWFWFTIPPSIVTVPFGSAMPQRPAGDGYKPGVRLRVKLAKSLGGDIREVAGVSNVWKRALNDLYDNQYMPQMATNAGKLPVVSLESVMPVESTNSKGRSINYQPVWRIIGWKPRPADMPDAQRAAMPVQTATSVQQPDAQRDAQRAANGNAANAPPRTGSTRMAPPAAMVAPLAATVAPLAATVTPPQTVTLGDDDFG